MKQKSGIFILAGSLLLCVCSGAKNPPVDLSVDFSSPKSIGYDFSCTIKGYFSWPDSASSLTSSLTCRLTGKTEGGERGRIVVHAKQVHVASDILDSMSAATLNLTNNIIS